MGLGQPLPMQCGSTVEGLGGTGKRGSVLLRFTLTSPLPRPLGIGSCIPGTVGLRGQAGACRGHRIRQSPGKLSHHCGGDCGRDGGGDVGSWGVGRPHQHPAHGLWFAVVTQAPPGGTSRHPRACAFAGRAPLKGTPSCTPPAQPEQHKAGLC